MHRSTFSPLQDANPTPSFGGFGLRRESFPYPPVYTSCWQSLRGCAESLPAPVHAVQLQTRTRCRRYAPTFNRARMRSPSPTVSLRSADYEDGRLSMGHQLCPYSFTTSANAAATYFCQPGNEWALVSEVPTNWWPMVPKEGFEPTHPCGHYVLNVARLPFRHFGTCTCRPTGVGGRGFEPRTSRV